MAELFQGQQRENVRTMPGIPRILKSCVTGVFGIVLLLSEGF